MDEPIAPKIVAALEAQLRRKVVQITDVTAARQAAARIQAASPGSDTLAGLHPVHAAYAVAQHHVAELSQAIVQLAEVQPLVELVADAEDEYMPEGPPMSPLTASYFACWSLFDAGVGAARETFGICVAAIAGAAGLDHDQQRLIANLQASRMGVYVHEGWAGELLSLREVPTGARCRAIVPAGYRGRPGQVWFTRVLPPPTPETAASLVLTTPYVLLHPGLDAWRAYFDRVLGGVPPEQRTAACSTHMKYGPAPRYWPEFIFEGYVNHEAGAIYLAGMPDDAKSRPHSWQYDGRYGR
jgi:hypothetical protein